MTDEERAVMETVVHEYLRATRGPVSLYDLASAAWKIGQEDGYQRSVAEYDAAGQAMQAQIDRLRAAIQQVLDWRALPIKEYMLRYNHLPDQRGPDIDAILRAALDAGPAGPAAILAVVEAAERVADYAATIRQQTGDCPICGDSGTDADHAPYCPMGPLMIACGHEPLRGDRWC